MIAVIQCAAKKRHKAGHLCRQDGTKVMFVAGPAIAPADSEYVYAHPDEMSDTGVSWRQALMQYNAGPTSNPWGLLPAFELYDRPAYRQLVDHLGASKVFILSAGWGLISASFLTPDYDITFNTTTKRKEPWKYRRGHYDDLCHLPASTSEPVVFFGGKDYVPLFCKLTERIKSTRTIFYRVSKRPETAGKPIKAPGCAMKAFLIEASTNWHYGCVKAFVKGGITIQ